MSKANRAKAHRAAELPIRRFQVILGQVLGLEKYLKEAQCSRKRVQARRSRADPITPCAPRSFGVKWIKHRSSLGLDLG